MKSVCVCVSVCERMQKEISPKRVRERDSTDQFENTINPQLSNFSQIFHFTSINISRPIHSYRCRRVTKLPFEYIHTLYWTDYVPFSFSIFTVHLLALFLCTNTNIQTISKSMFCCFLLSVAAVAVIVLLLFCFYFFYLFSCFCFHSLGTFLSVQQIRQLL